MEDVRIRLMDRGDLRAVWKLVEDNQPEFAPPGWPAASLDLQRMAFLHPRACREGSFVAEVGGGVRGALIFHNYREEGSATICLIVVDREAQRWGVGRALVEAWESNARTLGLKRLVAPEAPEEDTHFIEFAKGFGLREAGRVVSWVRGDKPLESPEDEQVVPLVNVSLSEVTEAFNECFPETPRTQDDLHALVTQSQWGPWASLGFVEGNRLLAFLFTTDREGKPYMQYVGTRPEARRRGLALKLLKHALHVLREGGAGAVECEVPEENVAAAELAASFGMKPGRRRVALVKELT